MCDETTIMREALHAVRLQLDARRIPHKVSASKAGVSISTWLSWFPAGGTPQVPSLACLVKLSKALPGDLLSLLVPDGFHIVRDEANLDYDTFAGGCIAYAAAHAQARHPSSPGGVDIVECERGDLDSKAVGLRAVKP